MRARFAAPASDASLPRGRRAAIPALDFRLHRILKTKDLDADRVVGEAIGAKIRDDAGDALAPEDVGRRTMNRFQLVGYGADQLRAGVKRERNEISHGRHHCPGLVYQW